MLATPADDRRLAARGYHRGVPIYEFRCDACGERFEELVDAGTEPPSVALCGAAGAERVLSAQAAPFGLVKTPGAARRAGAPQRAASRAHEGGLQGAPRSARAATRGGRRVSAAAERGASG